MTKITEKKPKGLWANIHAKRKRGEKSDPRSKEYKAAKKAGEKIRKQNEELAEPDGTIKFGTDSKDVKKMQKKGHTSVPYGSGYDKLNENFNKKILKAKTMKDIKKIYPKAVKPRAIHGAVFYVELEKDLWAKCFSTNSMKSIEPFNIEAIYKMKGKKQTFLWREGKLTEAGMYKDVSDKFKDALDKLPQKLFTSKNVAKLAKKMKEKRPDAAMAYAKDAFGWLMKENKLRTELRKHIVKEINTIFNSLP
tara:strand:- start:2059 stop:2808 length:750 start_codon:yes stop_codon:yes gene_type:complete